MRHARRIHVLICAVATAAPVLLLGQQSRGRAESDAPVVLVTAVKSQLLERRVMLPAELVAFEDVQLHPKVQGFVRQVTVDRGSIVKKGELLLRMDAPELDAQRSEAEAKVQSAQAQRIEAEAKLASDDATYQRLKNASSTPGVVAGNDLEVALKTVEADRARVDAWRKNEEAAAGAAKSVQQMDAYLRITAPFDGVITERNVHPGALVGPSSGPMLRLQEVARLRLVVYVPESDIAAIRVGQPLRFTVLAFPGEQFAANVQRVGRALDAKTRAMPVELDVTNRDGRLAPGMFPEVEWIARRTAPSLLVPPSAVASTTERTFVVRITNGVAEWIDVKKGATVPGFVEVFGALHAGDQVAIRGTDELRAGTRVQSKLVPAR